MNIYSNGKYKKLFVVSIIFLVVALFFVTKLTYGMEFAGGTRITTIPVEKDIDVHSMEIDIRERFEVQDLGLKTTPEGVLIVEYAYNTHVHQAEEALGAGDYDLAIQNAREITGDLDLEKEGEEEAEEYVSRARDQFNTELISYISQELDITSEQMSINTIGASLGVRFLNQSRNAILGALIFTAILVFFFFRRIILSIAVFQAPVYDLIFGLGAMGLLGIPLTLGTIAALLMLIGYSIDSDIMVADRITKRKTGTPEERAMGAMKTGLTMTLTTVSALSGLLVVSYITQISVLVSISSILIIGLLGDVIATWFTNAPLLIWQMKREGSK